METTKTVVATIATKCDLFNADFETGVHLTPLGETCDFLRFLKNVSRTPQELMSKLCAMGYLLCDYKTPSVAKAVVAFEKRCSGRSGTSLFGEFVARFKTVLHFNGKHTVKSLISLRAVEKTKIIFLDDVPAGFILEKLFNYISGDWIVRSGTGLNIIPFERSPKIYITSNHPLLGDGDSFRRRQWQIWFIDYYENNPPCEEFAPFFDGWDAGQWAIAWHLAAECVDLYSKLGYYEYKK
jgi:hypothetical protein